MYHDVLLSVVFWEQGQLAVETAFITVKDFECPLGPIV